jgi:hypothetical protein
MDLHSDRPPDPPPGSLFGDLFAAYRSPRLRAKLLTAVFVVDLAALVVAGFLLWDSLGVTQAVAAGQDISRDTLVTLELRGYQLQLISVALLIACVVTFALWTHRVATNAVALSGRLTISPGWAVGYYFVPIVNWWRPYTALAEVWDASHPDPRCDQSAPRCHALLLAWWITWLIRGAVDTLVFRRPHPADIQAWADDLRLGFAELIIEAIAVALALAVVWTLTRRQEERAAALMPEARIA